MRKKLSIIGLFCGSQEVSNGQSVKTRIVTEEIEKQLGTGRVNRIDTYGWKKNPVKLFARCIAAVRTSENVMFLTDEGGIRVFPRLLRWANIGGRCRLHYYVVGGWLHVYLDRNSRAAADLRKLDAIYVEIPAMLRELEERGFRNGVLVNKFRRMTPVGPEELDLNPVPPYKLCYFSRVMKEKGVEACIEAVKTANARAGFTKYTLDIFGSVNADYMQQFAALQADFPPFIRYGGIVDFTRSSVVLKDYFAMLFPTYYASEGYPNAVVDAYAAGLPVVATRWNYNADIIRDHADGILTDVDNVEQIIAAIEEMAGDPALHAAMRRSALARCREYLPEYAVAKVVEHLR